MQQRSSMALQTACQSVGIRGTAGCPLSLNMHGSCGGAELQVHFQPAQAQPATRLAKKHFTPLACDICESTIEGVPTKDGMTAANLCRVRICIAGGCWPAQPRFCQKD